MNNSKISFIILSFILIVTVAFTQTNSELSMIYLPQGIELDGLSGYGYHKTVKSSSATLLSANPASSQDYDRFTMSITYPMYAWVHFLYGQDVTHFFHTMGVVVPIKDIRIGIGSGQIFNYRTNYSDQYETLLEFNDNLGYKDPVSYNASKDEKIVKKSVSISYDLSKVNRFLNSIQIGAQYNSYKLNYNKKYWEEYNEWSYDRYWPRVRKIELKESFNASNISFGMRHTHKDLTQKTSYGLGVFYESQIKFDSISDTIRYVGCLPAKLNAGILFEKYNITLSGDIYYILWENVKNGPRMKNQIELAINIGYDLLNRIDITFEILQKRRPYIARCLHIDDYGLYKALLIWGFVYNFDPITIHIIVANGQDFSDEKGRQNIYKISTGFSFVH